MGVISEVRIRGSVCVCQSYLSKCGRPSTRAGVSIRLWRQASQENAIGADFKPGTRPDGVALSVLEAFNVRNGSKAVASSLPSEDPVT